MENETEHQYKGPFDAHLKEKFDEIQDFFEGLSHVLCAVTDALERIQPGSRDIMVDALHDKIRWLEHHKTPFLKAVMVLQTRDWIASPPPNPATPFDPPSPPACRILKFPEPPPP